MSQTIPSVIVQKCVRCHNGTKAPNSLRLDSIADMLKGGKRGPALVPGNPSKSLIWRASQGLKDGTVPEMPPFYPLSTIEKEVITQWIKSLTP
jgi:Planctomycete cytochrome C